MAQVGWEERRANMVEVCTVCHTDPYVENLYEQYDGVIELYNSKFANPGLAFMELLKENRLITETQTRIPQIEVQIRHNEPWIRRMDNGFPRRRRKPIGRI